MITLTGANNSVDLDDVSDSQLFHDWERNAEKLGNAAVEVHKVYKWGKPADVRMIQMTIHQGGRKHATFLRGATVDIMTILSDGRTSYLVIAEQYRHAAAQRVRSNPSGMVDAGELPSVAGLREAGEELGMTFEWSPAVNLNQQVFRDPAPLLVTPGGSDEAVTFFVTKAKVTYEQLKELVSRPGGLAAEREEIHLELAQLCHPVVSLHEEFRPATGLRDMKAMMSLLMYDKYLQYEAREE